MAVGEDDRVEAFHGGVYVGAGDGGVDGFVGCAGEDGVKVVWRGRV